mmetsp:Transcript_23365/g.43411  ORF Transcript_23365/g.43411 Transcript_23365/m.43411 type:complete len:604 (-) Transcript_23365:145-1956(-)
MAVAVTMPEQPSVLPLPFELRPSLLFTACPGTPLAATNRAASPPSLRPRAGAPAVARSLSPCVRRRTITTTTLRSASPCSARHTILRTASPLWTVIQRGSPPESRSCSPALDHKACQTIQQNTKSDPSTAGPTPSCSSRANSPASGSARFPVHGMAECGSSWPGEALQSRVDALAETLEADKAAQATREAQLTARMDELSRELQSALEAQRAELSQLAAQALGATAQEEYSHAQEAKHQAARDEQLTARVDELAQELRGTMGAQRAELSQLVAQAQRTTAQHEHWTAQQVSTLGKVEQDVQRLKKDVARLSQALDIEVMAREDAIMRLHSPVTDWDLKQLSREMESKLENFRDLAEREKRARGDVNAKLQEMTESCTARTCLAEDAARSATHKLEQDVAVLKERFSKVEAAEAGHHHLKKQIQERADALQQEVSLVRRNFTGLQEALRAEGEVREAAVAGVEQRWIKEIAMQKAGTERLQEELGQLARGGAAAREAVKSMNASFSGEIALVKQQLAEERRIREVEVCVQREELERLWQEEREVREEGRVQLERHARMEAQAADSEREQIKLQEFALEARLDEMDHALEEVRHRLRDVILHAGN